MPDPITTTAVGNNSTSVGGFEGWYLEQGPGWLADLLVNPPWWFETAGVLVSLVLLALVLRGLWLRGWRVDVETQSRMAYLAGVVVCTLVGTRAAMLVFEAPYLHDVLVGVVVGQAGPFGASAVHRWGIGHSWGRESVVMVAWACVAVVAFVSPFVVPMRTGLLSLGGLRWLLGLLAVVLLAYNELDVDSLAESGDGI